MPMTSASLQVNAIAIARPILRTVTIATLTLPAYDATGCKGGTIARF
jgi:hypothetical protein